MTRTSNFTWIYAVPLAALTVGLIAVGLFRMIGI
jgi:hypothetical protein